ncbi:hypothetical protein FALCPG4_015006 [Fusarium falciforme]
MRLSSNQLSPMTSLVTLILLLSPFSIAADECQPYRWDLDKRRDAPTQPQDPLPGFTPTVPWGKKPKPGEVKCVVWGRTYKDVNYYSCKGLAKRHGIDVETFFKLNPVLNPSCDNIKPYHLYCVRGYIQPKRAYDGLCGPKHGNATCLGTDHGCCNSETWTCGSSDEDCAAGTCYEGDCPGHKIYTTDGKCGKDHGMRVCAGKWGDCCSRDGVCGTGPGYCDEQNCQMGNCTAAATDTEQDKPNFPWLVGNTTDGSCGGPKGYTCDVVYGNCCNKHGICGSLPGDCGEGCQPEFGKCGLEHC